LLTNAEKAEFFQTRAERENATQEYKNEKFIAKYGIYTPVVVAGFFYILYKAFGEGGGKKNKKSKNKTQKIKRDMSS
jgi:hypothetical protein